MDNFGIHENAPTSDSGRQGTALFTVRERGSSVAQPAYSSLLPRLLGLGRLFRAVVQRLQTSGHAVSYEMVPARDNAEGVEGIRLPQYPKGRKCSKLLTITILSISVSILACFGIVHIILVVRGHIKFLTDVPQQRPYSSRWGLPNNISEGLTNFLANVSQDVVPIPCHSHNDYWRRVPLFDALYTGCTSVEADIWLRPGNELYVGHSRSSLSEARTLRSLYLDSIIDMLDQRNAKVPGGNATKYGLFEKLSEQTLVLLLDFKSDAHQLLTKVYEHIEPLRQRRYLSFWNGKELISGPITLVVTGNIPQELLTENTERQDVFVDAPLADMWASDTLANHDTAVLNGSIKAQTNYSGPVEDRSQHSELSSPWTLGIAYYASTSFGKSVGRPKFGRLSSEQMETLRGQIRGAHNRGLKVRYWDTPSWPTSSRNYIWKILLDEGSDVLNVDDLQAAAFSDWNEVSHNWFDG